MSLVYFPSCKFTAKYPQTSQAIQRYLQGKARVAGCCRPGLDELTEGDTAVYICNTCAAFLRESSRAKTVLSLWEVVLGDSDFPFPDHRGRVMTVQDCWRAYDGLAAQEAVRTLLAQMGVETLELPDHHRRTAFCGCTFSTPPPPHYARYAPWRLEEELRPLCVPCPPQERKARMEAHCRQIPTNEVVCSCVSCANGIELGGKQAVHLAQLLFPI